MGSTCSCRVCSKIPVLLARCLDTGILAGSENLSSYLKYLCMWKSLGPEKSLWILEGWSWAEKVIVYLVSIHWDLRLVQISLITTSLPCPPLHVKLWWQKHSVMIFYLTTKLWIWPMCFNNSLKVTIIVMLPWFSSIHWVSKKSGC